MAKDINKILDSEEFFDVMYAYRKAWDYPKNVNNALKDVKQFIKNLVKEEIIHKPDIVLYAKASKFNDNYMAQLITNASPLAQFNAIFSEAPNIKLTYSAETNELIAVELI